MSDAFLGEIRLVGFNFAPYGWAMCDGQNLPINQNAALFAVLSNTYGGDGIANFALPNLQGRTAVGQGAGPGLTARKLGDSKGEAAVTLDVTQLPGHTHPLQAVDTAANSNIPASQMIADTDAALTIYATTSSGKTLNAATIT